MFSDALSEILYAFTVRKLKIEARFLIKSHLTCLLYVVSI